MLLRVLYDDIVKCIGVQRCGAGSFSSESTPTQTPTQTSTPTMVLTAAKYIENYIRIDYQNKEQKVERVVSSFFSAIVFPSLHGRITPFNRHRVMLPPTLKRGQS